MTHPGLTEIIIGCVIFFAFIIWVVAEILNLSRFFLRLFSAIRNPPHVETTMKEMYPDVEYQGTRHAAVEIDKGGSRVRER